MVVEIAVSVIALTLIGGSVSLIIFLMKTRKLLEAAQKDLRNATAETINLMKKTDALVTDIKSKTDALDFVFHPLKAIGKGKHNRSATSGTVSEVVEWIGASLSLFNKIKNAVKHREK